MSIIRFRVDHNLEVGYREDDESSIYVVGTDLGLIKDWIDDNIRRRLGTDSRLFLLKSNSLTRPAIKEYLTRLQEQYYASAPKAPILAFKRIKREDLP